MQIACGLVKHLLMLFMEQQYIQLLKKQAYQGAENSYRKSQTNLNAESDKCHNGFGILDPTTRPTLETLKDIIMCC